MCNDKADHLNHSDIASLDWLDSSAAPPASSLCFSAQSPMISTGLHGNQEADEITMSADSLGWHQAARIERLVCASLFSSLR